MMGTGRRVRRAAIAALTVVCLGIPGANPAGADVPAVYYRVFLTDGSSLASYGEFARVADRLVFTMALNGAEQETPELQLVSIPAAKVDWDATERYAAAARASHFATTRGEAEYAELANEVAAALNDMALTRSPMLQLRIGEAARQRVAVWARDSYGYRSRDVAQLSSLLDEAVAEIRMSMDPGAGNPDRGRRFDLQLVATVAPPPAVPMAPPPDARASAQQALHAASLVEDAGERRSLLTAVARVLSASQEPWAAPLLASARTTLAAEARVDAMYARLTRSAVQRASRHAVAADVRGVQGVIADVLARDDGLGRRRPAEVGALLATLDARLEVARRLRLARDRWALNEPRYRAYAREIGRALVITKRTRPAIDDIQALAGPGRQTLLRTQLRTDEAALLLSRITPPEDLLPVHALLVSAVTLASAACAQRLDAIRTGELQTAWAASSAAAGALMLLERAQEDLTRWLKPPSLP